MTEEAATPFRPAEFSRMLLRAVEASQGRSKARKRDQTADEIGLNIRRGLLQEAIEADPEPDAFEAWLLEQVLASPMPGPVRAMGLQILEEYREACKLPNFGRWLAEGAPSADTTSKQRVER